MCCSCSTNMVFGPLLEEHFIEWTSMNFNSPLIQGIKECALHLASTHKVHKPARYHFLVLTSALATCLLNVTNSAEKGFPSLFIIAKQGTVLTDCKLTHLT